MNWILVFHFIIMPHQGHDAMSAVTPFPNKQECIAHAEHLFADWKPLREPKENHYHRLDSTMNYLGLNEEWVAVWSCIPDIPYERNK
tara:strand:- start:1686 stop:1946 length:261 start_codon:yes stop_codon:yes gene_type:complete